MQMDAIAVATGEAIATATARTGYAYGKISGDLERRGINALIPAKAEPIRSRCRCAASATMRWRVDVGHGEAETWHGLAPAVRRTFINMQIQA